MDLLWRSFQTQWCETNRWRSVKLPIKGGDLEILDRMIVSSLAKQQSCEHFNCFHITHWPIYHTVKNILISETSPKFEVDAFQSI